MAGHAAHIRFSRASQLRRWPATRRSAGGRLLIPWCRGTGNPRGSQKQRRWTRHDRSVREGVACGVAGHGWPAPSPQGRALAAARNVFTHAADV